jgi:hypothetical protein
MKRLQGLAVAGAMLFPLIGFARGETTETTRCYAAHFVRTNPAINLNELRLTVVYFNNGDLENAATIERLTVRDAFGTVLHDSGPKIGVPHPLNTVLTPPLDFTTVPPGATYTFATTNLWSGNVPGGLTAGSALSITVEVSKAGKQRLLVVHARESSRELTSIGAHGAERSADGARCFRITEGDD